MHVRQSLARLITLQLPYEHCTSRMDDSAHQSLFHKAIITSNGLLSLAVCLLLTQPSGAFSCSCSLPLFPCLLHPVFAPFVPTCNECYSHLSTQDNKLIRNMNYKYLFVWQQTMIKASVYFNIHT